MIHIDYRPVPECTNPDSFGEICVKCNQCGRWTRGLICLNCGREAEHILGVTWPGGWRRIELIDSFREPICDQCVPFFSAEELDPDRHTIWSYKKDFEKRGEAKDGGE